MRCAFMYVEFFSSLRFCFFDIDIKFLAGREGVNGAASYLRQVWTARRYKAGVKKNISDNFDIIFFFFGCLVKRRRKRDKTNQHLFTSKLYTSRRLCCVSHQIMSCFSIVLPEISFSSHPTWHIHIYFFCSFFLNLFEFEVKREKNLLYVNFRIPGRYHCPSAFSLKKKFFLNYAKKLENDRCALCKQTKPGTVKHGYRADQRKR